MVFSRVSRGLSLDRFCPSASIITTISRLDCTLVHKIRGSNARAMACSNSAARICAVCQSATSLKKCSRCQNTELFSSTCQGSDRPTHKASCQRPSAWYDAERRCEDRTEHEGRLELITWETSAVIPRERQWAGVIVSLVKNLSCCRRSSKANSRGTRWR